MDKLLNPFSLMLPDSRHLKLSSCKVFFFFFFFFFLICILWTQGSNLCLLLLHSQVSSLPLMPSGKPKVGKGLPWWLSGKEPAWQCRRCRFNHWVGKIPWRRKWQPTPVFFAWEIPWAEEPGCSPRSCRVRHGSATEQQGEERVLLRKCKLQATTIWLP